MNVQFTFVYESADLRELCVNARTVQRRVALNERLRIIDGSTPEGSLDRKVSASPMATRVAPLPIWVGASLANNAGRTPFIKVVNFLVF